MERDALTEAERLQSMLKLMITSACLLLSAVPSLAQDPTWVHPTEKALARAVDDGYSGRKLAKDELYQTIVYRKAQPAIDSAIEVDPPLVCALEMGQSAHNKLEEKPALGKVKELCDGSVRVVVVHYSQSLNANWPVVLERGEDRIQPAVKTLDTLPRVAKYYAGFVAMDQIGYRYVDIYRFNFPEKWLERASLTYADDAGVHHTLSLDFSAFARDELKHRQ